MRDRVLVHVQDHIASVRLNRPDKRNGLDLPMFEGLLAAAEQVASDRSVRAVVLSGEGKAFCAGLDWGAFLSMGREGTERLLERSRGPANLAQRVAWIWQELAVPVVAALHGAVLGGGFQIALGADLRYATPDAQLAAMEVLYGIVPDMSLSKTLLGLVRADVARELVFTGRTVSGEEALALGLVTRVCADPLAEAMEMARTLASRSPHAVRAGKRLLQEAPLLSVSDALLRETELQLALLGSPNQREAVAAMLGRRAPVFEDPARAGEA